MSINININANPYYDDFDQTKNYVKILFKPGYAVQARELTQMQTALQKQISNFGNHVFKDGSIVLNGNTSTTSCKFVDVPSNNYLECRNTSLTGQTSGSMIKVFYSTKLSDTSVRVFFMYTNGIQLESGELIKTADTSLTYQLPTADVIVADATLFSVDESVFYVSGYFVHCEKQTLVLAESNLSFSKRVGLKISQSVINSTDDQTLLDPAQGSYNYAAPGADRLAIGLTLYQESFDPETIGTNTIADFIELARYVNNELVFKVSASSYSVLEDNLARRTYDESGDYTVRPFSAKVTDHIYGDTNKLSLAIGPGKAYIKGYEFESIAPVNLDLDKSRDYQTKTNQSAEIAFGDYFVVNTPHSGVVSYTTGEKINITFNGVIIGSARASYIEYETTNRYRLYVYDFAITNSAYSSKDITSFSTDAGWIASIDTTYYGTNPVAPIKSNSRTNIIQLPDEMVKTLDAGGGVSTSYVGFTKFSGTIASYAVAFSVSPAAFLSSDPTDYFIVNASTGAVINALSAVLSNSNGTVTFSFDVASVASVNMYTRVAYDNVSAKNKTIATATLNISRTTDAISLGYADCYRVVSIIATATSSSLVEVKDVTNYYTFNNGQTDELYDHGYIQMKPDSLIEQKFDTITVTFEYFSSTGSGFFSVDSYTASTVAYEDIPTYRASSGKLYRLTDCIDFRPVRAPGGTALSSTVIPVVNSRIILDYSFYLSRIDKVVLTKERKITLIRGTSSVTPTQPNDLYDAMTLYIVRLNAYTANTADVSLTFIDNKRYTMRDIGKIDKRVEKIEYYTALSLLEKQAKDESIYGPTGIDRFKNGMLVDSFAGHNVGYVDNPDYSCSINKEERTLRPRFASYSFNYKPLTLGSASKIGDLITLPWTSAVFAEQYQATTFANVNPFQVFQWNGSVTLNPATDNWVATDVRPTVTVNLNNENDVYTTLVDNVNNPAAIGTNWGDWQTVVKGVAVNSSTDIALASTNGSVSASSTTNTSTTVDSLTFKSGVTLATSAVSTVNRDIGTKVVDVSVVPYIRSRVVTFAAKNLKPKTDLYASFDGVDVTAYCTPAIRLTFSGTPDSDIAAVETLGGAKTAKVVLSRPNSLYVILDSTSKNFTIGEKIYFIAANTSVSSVTGYTLTSVSAPLQLTTDETGDIGGAFLIPDPSVVKFTTGEKIFRLADVLGTAPSTAAEVKYVAQGLSQSTERTILATRVASASISPTTEYSNKTNQRTTSLITNTTTSNTVDVVQPPEPGRILAGDDNGDFSKGKAGTFNYMLDYATNHLLFTTDAATYTGGITYQPTQKPVRYTLVYNGNTYTTGFIGSSDYDNQLVALGYPKVVGSGSSGTLPFNKNVPNDSATLKVEAPLDGTDWLFKVPLLAEFLTPPPLVKTYEVLTTASVVSENSTAVFTVLTKNVPNNTVLYWGTTVVGGTLVAADFGDNVLTGTVTIKDNKGEISRNIKADGITEATSEIFSIFVSETNGGAVAAKSTDVTIIDTSKAVAAYTVTSSTQSIKEGETVTFDVSTLNVADATTLYWTINTLSSGITSADFKTAINGSVVITGGIASIKTTTALDMTTEGQEQFYLELRTTSISGTIVASSNVVYINDTSTTAVTYSIASVAPVTRESANHFSYNEGDDVTYTIKTTGLSDGTVLYWNTATIEGTLATTDFKDAVLTGQVTVVNNSASLVRGIAKDGSTEGVEDVFVIELKTGSITGTTVAVSNAVTIIDADAIRPAITAIPTKTSLNEGDTLSVIIKTENYTDPTTLYWSINSILGNVNASDFTDTVTSGTISVAGNGDTTLTRKITADLALEGLETFTISFRTGSGVGPVVARTATIVIRDTSAPPSYSIVPNSRSTPEGVYFDWRVNILNGTPTLYAETLYWTHSTGTTAVAADFTDVAVNGSIAGGITSSRLLSRFITADLTVEGTELIGLDLRTGSVAGPIVATSGLTSIVDTSVPVTTYALEIANTTINEGASLAVNVNTTNLANGPLYWTVKHGGTATADFQAVSGTVNIINNAGAFIVTAATDIIDETPEKFTLELRTGSIAGTVVIESATCTITNVKPVYNMHCKAAALNQTMTVRYNQPSTQILPVVDTAVVYNFTTSWTAANSVLLNTLAKYRPSVSINVASSNGQATSITPIDLVISGLAVSQDKEVAGTVTIPAGAVLTPNTVSNIMWLIVTWTYDSGDANIPALFHTLVTSVKLTANNVINVVSAPQVVDPLAQTFFVDAKSYPNGVYINSLDLYFRKKAVSAPVMVQLRTTENGYPSSSTILPFAQSSKLPSEVTVSATGTASTNFKLENVVHLSPGEYCFVVLADTDEYEIFTAKLGEFSLTNTAERITKQPAAGSMFKSQNASTWSAVQEEDIKFKLNKCIFNTTASVPVVLETDVQTGHGNIPYEILFADGETVNFAATGIKYEYDLQNSGIWTTFQPGSNVKLPASKTLSTSSSNKIRVTLNSTDKNVSPIVDCNRFSNVLVHNIINNDAGNETAAFNGNAVAKYVTRKVKLNAGFEATDLKVYLLAQLPTGTSIKVYYKVSTLSDTYFDDNSYVEMMVETAGTYSETEYVEYKYKTPYTSSEMNEIAIETGERFDTFSVKIVMLSADPVLIPSIRDLRVIALDD